MNKFRENILNSKFCNVCPRKCNVDRSKNFGFCGATDEMKVAKVMVHMWEEPFLTGICEEFKNDENLQANNCNLHSTNSKSNLSCTPEVLNGKNTQPEFPCQKDVLKTPSKKADVKLGCGAIFFSNCNLKCIYCQNYEINDCNYGKTFSPQDLANTFKQLEKQNVCSIELVTPTHFVKGIIQALLIYKPKVPVIFNTSGYETEETINALDGLIDIYLFDFKYANPKNAMDYSRAKDYPEICKKALLCAKKQIKNDVFENGLMKKGIVIRHLLLPKASGDGIEIINFIAENLGKNTFVSLLNQYVPLGQALHHPILKHKPTNLEYKRLVSYAQNLGMPNVFLQEKCSSSTDFIPDFKTFCDF